MFEVIEKRSYYQLRNHVKHSVWETNTLCRYDSLIVRLRDWCVSHVWTSLNANNYVMWQQLNFCLARILIIIVCKTNRMTFKFRKGLIYTIILQCNSSPIKSIILRIINLFNNNESEIYSNYTLDTVIYQVYLMIIQFFLHDKAFVIE